jgi:hypothetical protein
VASGAQKQYRVVFEFSKQCWWKLCYQQKYGRSVCSLLASRGSTECLQSRVDTIAPTHGCLADPVWSEPKTKARPACAHEANAARLRQRSVALASSCQVLLDALPARITSSVLGCCDHFPSFAISASKCSNYIDISGDSSGFC